jgi:hypothetical protein
MVDEIIFSIIDIYTPERMGRLLCFDLSIAIKENAIIYLYRKCTCKP